MKIRGLLIWLAIIFTFTFTIWGITTISERINRMAIADLKVKVKSLTQNVLSLQKAVVTIQDILIVEHGKASWYGKPFHGRITASGEVYDMYKVSAAHKTLPLKSWVWVVNLENGRVLDIRINDRGPFIEGRIIDLSYAAAKILGVVKHGTADVKVVAISG